ncbi:MAG: LIC_10190 family membrane protein [Cyanophyceae cyanobacterium]
MLYSILIWVTFGAACLVVGTALLSLLKIRCFESSKDYYSLAVWLGVVVFALSFLSLSLWVPLSAWVGATMVTALVSLSLVSADTRKSVFGFCQHLSPGISLQFLCLGLAVAALTIQQMEWFDSGLYHIGAIKWLSEFGSVPGVALIHHRFGFTSAWFALSAPLTPEFLGTRIGATTNGLIFLIFSWHFLLTLAQTSERTFADWFIVTSSSLIIPALVVEALTGSPLLISFSPDVSIILLITVAAWTILVTGTSPAAATSSNARIVPVVLAIGAVAMKLTALPLLAIAVLFYLCQNCGTHAQSVVKRALTLGFLLVLVLTPVAASGIVTSGCPLFPSTFMCLDLPWTVPEQLANQELTQVRGQQTMAETRPGYLVWLWQQWIHYPKSQLILGLLVVSMGATGWWLWKHHQRQRQEVTWVAALGSLGLLFIVFKAPWIRFGIGYGILIPALILAHGCQNTWGRVKPLLPSSLLSLQQQQISALVHFAGTLLASLAIVVLMNDKLQSRLLLPANLPQPQVVQSKINDVEYVYPEDWYLRCWAASLPCAEVPKKGIKLRDPSQGIRAGFVRAE